MLLECADRGVEVRLTVDHYSDVVLSDFHPLLVHRLPEMRQERVRTHALFDRLRDHSVGVRRTAPPGALGRYLLFRDHKKLVILDDRVAFVGGINVSDHNFDWHDLMVRIEGPRSPTSRPTTARRGPATPSRFADARPDGDFVLNHDAGRESILEELMRMIAGARETLVIESPYLLGDRLEREIVGAAQRGVQVTLIVPDRANRGIVRLWRRRTLQRFQHPNIALLGYRATGGMLHAKFAIADGRPGDVRLVQHVRAREPHAKRAERLHRRPVARRAARAGRRRRPRGVRADPPPVVVLRPVLVLPVLPLRRPLDPPAPARPRVEGDVLLGRWDRYRLEVKYLVIAALLLGTLVVLVRVDAFSGINGAVDHAMDQGAKFGFVGIFLIALVANLSLIIQIPYTLPILAAAVQGDSLAHIWSSGSRPASAPASAR